MDSMLASSTGFALIKYFKSLVIETETVCLLVVFAELVGSKTFSAFGLTIVETMMKKMSSRKTKSVMDAMLKFTFTLFLVCNAINLLNTNMYEFTNGI